MLKYFLVALFYFPAMVLIIDSALFISSKHYSYKPEMHYATISTGYGCVSPAMQALRMQYPRKINNNLPSAALHQYEHLRQVRNEEDIMMFSFAIAVLLSIATIAFLILFFFGRKITPFPKLLLIVIAGFWFAEPLRLLQMVFGNECGLWEISIAEWFHLPSYSILIMLSVIAILISAFIFFRIIPKGERIKFTAASISGSGAGLALWMLIIGPAILP